MDESVQRSQIKYSEQAVAPGKLPSFLSIAKQWYIISPKGLYITKLAERACISPRVSVYIITRQRVYHHAYCFYVMLNGLDYKESIHYDLLNERDVGGSADLTLEFSEFGWDTYAWERAHAENRRRANLVWLKNHKPESDTDK